jgi:uncharacterized protein YdiU (UPF0061 family)
MTSASAAQNSSFANKAGFPISNNEFATRFISFTEESLKACSVQAEKSVNMVAKILDEIVADSARVSKLSEDTINALKAVKKFLEVQAVENVEAKLGQKKNSKEVLQQIMDALKVLGEHNSDVSQFVTPMIESLQFQDRIRQQMDNLPKMIRVWMKARVQVENECKSEQEFDEMKSQFGKDLLAVSISEQERNVIRKHIPGLPEAENMDKDDFFF